MIHINRDRKSLGKFIEQEVADGLKSGRFLPTDLAWRDPMPSWLPLSSFIDLPVASDEAAVEGSLEGGQVEDDLKMVVEPAWERGEGNFPAGTAIESIRRVLGVPTTTFRQMPIEGGFLKPMLFYILVGWVSGGVAIGYQLLAALINPTMVFGESAKDLSSPMMVAIFAGILFLLPVFLIFGVFMSAAFFHLSLMMTGAASKPFEATFRALAYAQGATSVFQFLPLCGGYLYPALSIVYSVLALREVHRAELWRVVLAAVLLFFLFCGLAMGAAMLFVGLGAPLVPAR